MRVQGADLMNIKRLEYEREPVEWDERYLRLIFDDQEEVLNLRKGWDPTAFPTLS